MSRGRFFIERRTGPKHYHPIGTQPAEGFGSVREAMRWLLARGAIRERWIDGEMVFEGMGGDRGFYVREVPAPRAAKRGAWARAIGVFERVRGLQGR